MSGPLAPRDAPRSGISGRLDAASPAERLQALARQIRALSPDWRCPERYFEMRSELAEEARRLARWLEAR